MKQYFIHFKTIIKKKIKNILQNEKKVDRKKTFLNFVSFSFRQKMKKFAKQYRQKQQNEKSFTNQ
jgi:hypothetical protein